MEFPKRNKSNRFLIDQAKRSYASGAVIDWGTDCDEWVSIDVPDTEGISMQGESATEFMNEVEVITKRYPSFDDYTAVLVVASPYIECLC